MAENSLDLAQIFKTVTKVMGKNKTTLNEADTYNHDHGSNMVQTFKVITQAMEERKDASPADQLAYASELLRAKQHSGSAQLYADGLSRAADEFQGKNVTADNATQLIQALMGGGQVQSSQPQASADPTGGLLGTLLGGLTGMGESTQQNTPRTGQQDAGGFDTASLLSAGMEFFQAKQRGASNFEALTNAILSNSQMNDGGHRSQSGALVANTLMQVIGSMATGKK